MSRIAKYEIEEKIASNRYSSIKSRVSKSKNNPYNLEDFWERENFIKWYKNQPKICCYCGCTEDQIKSFYNLKNKAEVKRINRGQSLEIERIEDTKYTEDNCKLSCYWCNNAKSDVFTYEEFKHIGLEIGKVIKSKFE